VNFYIISIWGKCFLWCSWATLSNWRNLQILSLTDLSLQRGPMEEWWRHRRTKDHVAYICHLSAC